MPVPQSRQAHFGIDSTPTGNDLVTRRSLSIRPQIEYKDSLARAYARRTTGAESASYEVTGPELLYGESGEVTVTIGGDPRATLGPGDYFGEIALIDEGVRIASIVAVDDLVCYGLTLWELRPLVEANGVIGWKLLQTLAKDLREAEQVIAELRTHASTAGN